uniref:Amino acid transporter transmembrane domain-containing protein n=1 Tax=Leersia perrieri TaxID=77586 RepID=A0A0D9W642_9ORYZ
MGLGDGYDGAAAPLLTDRTKHLTITRSGTEWTAAAHVITAVIGSGVLSLAWSVAQLGWVAGPGMMLVFAAVTALQSMLFADCYRSPDPEVGPHRNRTYANAVERNLGKLSLSPFTGITRRLIGGLEHY